MSSEVALFWNLAICLNTYSLRVTWVESHTIRVNCSICCLTTGGRALLLLVVFNCPGPPQTLSHGHGETSKVNVWLLSAIGSMGDVLFKLWRAMQTHGIMWIQFSETLSYPSFPFSSPEIMCQCCNVSWLHLANFNAFSLGTIILILTHLRLESPNVKRLVYRLVHGFPKLQ